MSTFKKISGVVLLTIGVLLTCVNTNAQVVDTNIHINPEWVKDQEPFRIAGNLYYVGTYDLACYLITTPQGHILINTGIASSAPMIQAHIAQLGFKVSDIKILLATHAHFDHVGAMAAMKKITGAQLMINEKDAPLLADGGNSDYIFGGHGTMFEPVKVDRVLHGHDTVSLGGMHIAVLHHPGHTPGACSFLFTVKDEKHSYRVLIANLPKVLDETDLSGMPGYPNVSKDFAYTYDAMKKVRFDIWVASHASQFDMHDKHKKGGRYNPAAFIDRKGYDAVLNTYQKEYLAKLNSKKK